MNNFMKTYWHQPSLVTGTLLMLIVSSATLYASIKTIGISKENGLAAALISAVIITIYYCLYFGLRQYKIRRYSYQEIDNLKLTEIFVEKDVLHFTSATLLTPDTSEFYIENADEVYHYTIRLAESHFPYVIPLDVQINNSNVPLLFSLIKLSREQQLH